jgi:hypothetical protein
MIAEWLAAPPPIPPAPSIRRAFLSRVDVERILSDEEPQFPIRGDLQTHTWGSDGTAWVRAVALAAAARGLEYLAITDHSKDLRIANGMTETQIGRQGEEIRRLNCLPARGPAARSRSLAWANPPANSRTVMGVPFGAMLMTCIVGWLASLRG